MTVAPADDRVGEADGGTTAVVFPRTKFHRPPARDEHVPRELLLDRIDRSGARMLSVTAPPGFGKSTLLAQWAATREDPARSAWVSVDADDRGARLWAAVLAALRPVLGDALDDALRASTAPDADLRDDVLVALLDALAATDEPVALVLDDVHVVLDDQRTRSSVDWVLDRLPDPHAVALGSRRTADLRALGRRRVRGELFEVRTDELRFDRDESAAFVRDGLGLDLDDDALDVLGDRVEGWPAALYLAALRVRMGEPIAELLGGSLGRGDEELFGGLADEVLASWPPHHRRFVREASILPRFTADLCVRTLGGDPDETRQAFRELTRTSLLLIPLDRGRTWFRCHHLLRDVLRGRLEDEEPERARELHVRAGAWLESEGGESELYEALEHYLAARSWEPAAELLATHALRLVGFGVLAARARDWLARFPPELRHRDARLAYVAALVAAVDGDRAGRDAWLSSGAEAGWDGPMPDGTASYALAADALTALVCFDDVGTALAAGARVLDALPRAAPARSAVEAATAWHELLRGHLDAAEALAYRALAGQELLPAVGLPLVGPLSAAVVALVALDRGDVDVAAGYVADAETALQHGPLRTAPQALPVVAARARLALVHGRSGDAVLLCRAGLEHARGWRDPSLMVPALLVELARACTAEGDHDGAAEALREARERVDPARDPGALRASIAALPAGRQVRAAGSGAELSERELDVLRALAGSGSLRDVAAGLRVSHNTVKTHARTLYAKLGVASRADAVAAGRELGLLGRGGRP
ncbi:LuxR C-terminal-related transcriptional regulator [Patulibacter minatonensis]|uniref:LuxR C-terminal-related transcriptional regulator n=1 Tax=Patulibacter minatonensis TaxID=298163 RepID=UPI00146FC814|nr:LuxR C-terminal-related transcriptional regulator [Patulibacter minatonensis]